MIYEVADEHILAAEAGEQRESVCRGQLGVARGSEDRPPRRDRRRRLQDQGDVYPTGLAPVGRNLDRYDIPYAGRLIAWDPIARQPRWIVEYGNYWNGGTLATAGNLVFQGTAEGDFIAYRASDGEKLWSAYAGTGIVAPPITYAIDGKQYVSVMAGWGGAFARKARTRGRLYCARCHGGATVLPDLRRSAPAVYNSYEKILIDGALVERGMPRFEYLDKAAVAALRAYVLDERRKLAAAQ